MPTELTPGQRYLLRQLPYLAAPPAVVYLASRFAHDHLDRALPTWLLLLAYLFCWPVAFVLNIQWNDLSNAVRARRWGAVMPPTIEAKYPGGLDIISGMFRSDRSSYLGESSLFDSREVNPYVRGCDRKLCKSSEELNVAGGTIIRLRSTSQPTPSSNGVNNMATPTTSGSCSKTG